MGKLRIDSVLQYSSVYMCARTYTAPFLCMCTCLCVFAVCVSTECQRFEPRDKCMKCYCGGAGPAPEEVLGFDNALTRNALQATAKWACRCSGVGSQVWTVQFWPLRLLGGPSRSAVVQKRELPEGKWSESGCRFVCKLSLFECVCVCVFSL